MIPASGKTPLLRIALLVSVIALFALGRASAAPETPEQTEITVGVSRVHVEFQNVSLARAMSEQQMKMLAAAIGSREGDFFFIVSEEAPNRVFACGPPATTHHSLSINLPPNSSLLRVTSTQHEGRSALLVNGIRNETSGWSGFSSAGSDTYLEHRTSNGFATAR